MKTDRTDSHGLSSTVVRAGDRGLLRRPPASSGSSVSSVVAFGGTHMRIVTLVLASAFVAQPSPAYRITHTYRLGGEGSWDYVVPDPPNHRLFIARQNRVMVVDENDGKLLGEVTGIQGAHGTALAQAT